VYADLWQSQGGKKRTIIYNLKHLYFSSPTIFTTHPSHILSCIPWYPLNIAIAWSVYTPRSLLIPFNIHSNTSFRKPDLNWLFYIPNFKQLHVPSHLTHLHAAWQPGPCPELACWDTKSRDPSASGPCAPCISPGIHQNLDHWRRTIPDEFMKQFIISYQ